MPKYEGKQNFSFLSIPEVGEKESAEAAWTKNGFMALWVANMGVYAKSTKNVAI